MAESQPRRFSGVAKLGHRMSLGFKASSASAPIEQQQQEAPPPPSSSASKQVASVYDQLKLLEREGFVAPRGFPIRRAAIGSIFIAGKAVSFRISVLHSTSFDVTVENGAASPLVEGVSVKCQAPNQLSERGRKMMEKDGHLVHPVFKAKTSMGGWLPHYPVAVLIFLLLRLVDVEETELDVLYAAVGPMTMDVALATGVAIHQGKRNSMEDYKLVSQAQKNTALFGIFDGHGGAAAAEFASKNLANQFYATFPTQYAPQEPSQRARACRDGLKSAIEQIDSRFLSETRDNSGCTACVVCCDLTTLCLHVGNVGDTRAVLCRAGEKIDLSYDHKAMNPMEIARIIDSGGFVARNRAMGLLAISRALGDRELKRNNHRRNSGSMNSSSSSSNNNVYHQESPITALSDVDTFVLDPTHDEFFIIACDGLFDVMTSQQAISFVRNKLIEGFSEEEAANILANYAINDLGTMDNVTIIVVGFSWSHLTGGGGESATTPRDGKVVGTPTSLRRSESATLQAAKASARKRQTSRMSSQESISSLGGMTGYSQ